MPAKTPIYLKTSTPKRGRKLRLRDVLSSDMISPPLGDFRHSAHIGPEGEGDMFGELSFLQGKYDLLPSLGRRLASQSAQAVGHEPARGPTASGYRSLLKSAVSLPVFSGAPSPEQAPPKPPRLHLEELPSSQRSMSPQPGPPGSALGPWSILGKSQLVTPAPLTTDLVLPAGTWLHGGSSGLRLVLALQQLLPLGEQLPSSPREPPAAHPPAPITVASEPLALLPPGVVCQQ
uniref:CRIB domain-containing protein n=1 Tax=Chrysemys picta bellii TaxID=8478 RepID=A0A8C3IAL2_CHRPI